MGVKAWWESTEGRGMMSKRKCEWKKTTNEEQQQNKDDNQHRKNLTGGSPKQVLSLGVFDFWLWTQKIYISEHKYKNYVNSWCFYCY